MQPLEAGSCSSSPPIICQLWEFPVMMLPLETHRGHRQKKEAQPVSRLQLEGENKANWQLRQIEGPPSPHPIGTCFV